MPARAGAAPFQQVVGKELDMRPHPVGCSAEFERGNGCRLSGSPLRGSGAQQCKSCKRRKRD
jgi:hypothetical protein